MLEKAFVIAQIPLWLYIIVMEALVHFPVPGTYLDTTNPSMILRQLPILAAGVVITYWECWPAVSIQEFRKSWFRNNGNERKARAPSFQTTVLVARDCAFIQIEKVQALNNGQNQIIRPARTLARWSINFSETDIGRSSARRTFFFR